MIPLSLETSELALATRRGSGDPMTAKSANAKRTTSRSVRIAGDKLYNLSRLKPVEVKNEVNFKLK
jgi:hypothetical protein